MASRRSDPGIGDSLFPYSQQQLADTGQVYLNAQVVVLRMFTRHVQQGLTHAETNLQVTWCLPAEQPIEVERPLLRDA